MPKMQIVQSLNALKKIVSENLADSLIEDVAPEVRRVMKEHIISDVYEAYEPEEYERRFSGSYTDYNDTDDTGLADEGNIEGYSEALSSGAVLDVFETTVGAKYYYDKKGKKRVSQNAGKPIAGVIETGDGYDVYSPGKRPFMKNTEDELISMKICEKALEEGLKRKGMM